MISIVPQGRLGNQLFQYAFAYSLSRSLGTSFFIFPSSHDKFVVVKYFVLRRFERVRLLLAFFSYYFNRLFKRPQIFLQTGWDEAESILKTANQFPSAVWNGFFQSVAYFKTHQTDINKLFTPRAEYKSAFERKYGTLMASGKKIAILHIRRTDYLDWGSDKLGGKNMTLPMNYYTECIDLAGGLSDYHTIVLSDDVDFVRDYFKTSGFFFEHNSEIIDLLLLMNADLLIVSNSTFAWWGSLLNKRNARVFAPEYWLGFKIDKPYPVNIKQYLDWTWVKVKKSQ
jgi:hypothetical protein